MFGITNVALEHDKGEGFHGVVSSALSAEMEEEAVVLHNRARKVAPGPLFCDRRAELIIGDKGICLQKTHSGEYYSGRGLPDRVYLSWEGAERLFSYLLGALEARADHE
ncbi:hypothetical protein LCGC14_1057890 [marine sediment metagenome]|uniref:Uncharacterized protein n=1 Tax=marine sediment metagenome TaxID=412755 RepID=A0A0F9Q517_9ZZZZ